MDLNLSTINALSFVIFTFFVILSTIRISLRLWNYKKENLKVPVLLPRDLGLFLSFGYILVSILAFRTFGITPSEHAWYTAWVLSSDIVGILGVGQWAYFEFFVIDKPK